MENGGLNVLSERCGSLRWKGMFVDVQQDHSVPDSGDHIYWCVHTQSIMGPDGQVADGDICNATRSCYQPV